MFSQYEIATIDTELRVALFRNGASAIIIQWMDGEGQFHNEAVEAPLALIVQDHTEGYHVIDLRIIPAAGRC